MQSPKSLFTIMALGAVILTPQANAEVDTPEAHLAASTQGAVVHTFTHSLTSSADVDGASADDAEGVNGQARPDMHKAAELGKTTMQTGTVSLGGITADGSDAGKSSPAKPQARPEMRKYSSMGKYGKPSTATISLGASSKGAIDAGQTIPRSSCFCSTTAAAVSSQEVSIPRIINFL